MEDSAVQLPDYQSITPQQLLERGPFFRFLDPYTNREANASCVSVLSTTAYPSPESLQLFKFFFRTYFVLSRAKGDEVVPVNLFPREQISNEVVLEDKLSSIIAWGAERVFPKRLRCPDLTSLTISELETLDLIEPDKGINLSVAYFKLNFSFSPYNV